MDRIYLAMKILGPIIGVVISPIIAYIKYNSTREVAKGLIDIGNQNFGIKKSKCKTLPLCWEWSVFLSGITCVFFPDTCCSCCLKRSEDNHTYNAAEETILLQLGQQPSYESNKPVQEISTNGQLKVGVLVETARNILPSNAWKVDGSLDPNAVQELNKMLNMCQKITYSNFLLHFQKYADSLFSKGRNSHEYHCRHAGCMTDGHSQFASGIGCLEPILYYGVFDWSRFREISEEQSTKGSGWCLSYIYFFVVFNIIRKSCPFHQPLSTIIDRLFLQSGQYGK